MTVTTFVHVLNSWYIVSSLAFFAIYTQRWTGLTTPLFYKALFIIIFNQIELVQNKCKRNKKNTGAITMLHSYYKCIH